MAKEFSLLGFAAFLGEVVEGAHAAKKGALEKAATIIEDEAKRVIGTYDYGWPELAESTQSQRESLGFPADEPLLRTGEMRDSIEHTVHADDGEAHIGSNEDKAVWQELGTAGGGRGGPIPPRPFLAGAAAQKGDEVAKLIGEEMVEQVLMGKTLGKILPTPSQTWTQAGGTPRIIPPRDESGRFTKP